jgi:hypothetical protein
MQINGREAKASFLRARNNLTEPTTRGFALAIPLGNLIGELITKTCELPDSLVQGLQMSPGQIQDVGARCVTSPAQRQNLADFVE